MFAKIKEAFLPTH